jgi:HTH-type transcriptional regulator/antitoxin HigA
MTDRHIPTLFDIIDNIIKEEGYITDDVSFKQRYSEKTILKFKMAKEIISLARNAMQHIDWLVSGDDGEDSFNEKWDKEINLDELEKLQDKLEELSGSIPPYEYKPDYISCPGSTIKEILAERLAEKIDVSPYDIEEILEGNMPINEEMAEKLAKEFDVPVSFWIKREKDYREKFNKKLNKKNQ